MMRQAEDNNSPRGRDEMRVHTARQSQPEGKGNPGQKRQSQLGRGDEGDRRRRVEARPASGPCSEENESRLHTQARESTHAGIEKARIRLAREPGAPDS